MRAHSVCDDFSPLIVTLTNHWASSGTPSGTVTAVLVPSQPTSTGLEGEPTYRFVSLPMPYVSIALLLVTSTLCSSFCDHCTLSWPASILGSTLWTWGLSPVATAPPWSLTKGCTVATGHDCQGPIDVETSPSRPSRRSMSPNRTCTSVALPPSVDQRAVHVPPSPLTVTLDVPTPTLTGTGFESADAGVTPGLAGAIVALMVTSVKYMSPVMGTSTEPPEQSMPEPRDSVTAVQPVPRRWPGVMLTRRCSSSTCSSLTAGASGSPHTSDVPFETPSLLSPTGLCAITVAVNEPSPITLLGISKFAGDDVTPDC